MAGKPCQALREASNGEGGCMSESLAEALPKECARVRKVLGAYREIGPSGAIGASFIEQDLRAADKAMISGDVVAMLKALTTLQGVK